MAALLSWHQPHESPALSQVQVLDGGHPTTHVSRVRSYRNRSRLQEPTTTNLAPHRCNHHHRADPTCGIRSKRSDLWLERVSTDSHSVRTSTRLRCLRHASISFGRERSPRLVLAQSRVFLSDSTVIRSRSTSAVALGSGGLDNLARAQPSDGPVGIQIDSGAICRHNRSAPH